MVPHRLCAHLLYRDAGQKIALWCNFRIDEGTALKANMIRLPASTTELKAVPRLLPDFATEGQVEKQLHQFANQSSMTGAKQSLPESTELRIEIIKKTFLFIPDTLNIGCSDKFPVDN
jgi:hypothetical protein